MDETEKLDQLAHEMFRRYSRMEYALKAAGYLRHLNGDAQADWVKLATEIDDAFLAARDNDPALKEAVHYLLNHPPKKQIVEEGVLGWSDNIPTSDTETGVILLCVSRVRNNLFHGGKFNGRWFDPERSIELLPKCLLILDTVLNVSPGVRERFGH